MTNVILVGDPEVLAAGTLVTRECATWSACYKVLEVRQINPGTKLVTYALETYGGPDDGVPVITQIAGPEWTVIG